MNELLELFEKWENGEDYPKYPELRICSDGSGALAVSDNYVLVEFDTIAEIAEWFVKNTKQ